MAYNSNLPADNEFISIAPAELRENNRALLQDQIVDAGALKGLVPGNASGNIPVSNGTICTNLNAEKLGGNTASYFAPGTHINSTTGHPVATTSANGFLSNTDKQKLDGIATGAEVNQSAFSYIQVGATQIAADSKTDTLTLTAGTGIALTPNAVSDSVTIAVIQDGHSHANATASAAGFQSSADYNKLAGIQAGAEVNQLAFSNILVGGTTIAADSKTDTVEFVAGTNITLTPDITNDRVTIAVTGKVASALSADYATSAGDANTVDGKHASDFVSVNGGSITKGVAGAPTWNNTSLEIRSSGSDKASLTLNRPGYTEVTMYHDGDGIKLNTNNLKIATVDLKPFIISAIAPSDTTKLWIDNNGVAYFYNGTAWISIKGTFLD